MDEIHGKYLLVYNQFYINWTSYWLINIVFSQARPGLNIVCLETVCVWYYKLLAQSGCEEKLWSHQSESYYPLTQYIPYSINLSIAFWYLRNGLQIRREYYKYGFNFFVLALECCHHLKGVMNWERNFSLSFWLYEVIIL